MTKRSVPNGKRAFFMLPEPASQGTGCSAPTVSRPHRSGCISSLFGGLCRMGCRVVECDIELGSGKEVLCLGGKGVDGSVHQANMEIEKAAAVIIDAGFRHTCSAPQSFFRRLERENHYASEPFPLFPQQLAVPRPMAACTGISNSWRGIFSFSFSHSLWAGG